MKTKALFESGKIGVPCPKCGQKTKHKLARLRAIDDLTCPSCGETFSVDAKKLGAGVDQANEAAKAFRRQISRLNKR